MNETLECFDGWMVIIRQKGSGFCNLETLWFGDIIGKSGNPRKSYSGATLAELEEKIRAYTSTQKPPRYRR